MTMNFSECVSDVHASSRHPCLLFCVSCRRPQDVKEAAIEQGETIWFTDWYTDFILTSILTLC